MVLISILDYFVLGFCLVSFDLGLLLGSFVDWCFLYLNDLGLFLVFVYVYLWY